MGMKELNSKFRQNYPLKGRSAFCRLLSCLLIYTLVCGFRSYGKKVELSDTSIFSPQISLGENKLGTETNRPRKEPPTESTYYHAIQKSDPLADKKDCEHFSESVKNLCAGNFSYAANLESNAFSGVGALKVKVYDTPLSRKLTGTESLDSSQIEMDAAPFEIDMSILAVNSEQGNSDPKFASADNSIADGVNEGNDDAADSENGRSKLQGASPWQLARNDQSLFAYHTWEDDVPQLIEWKDGTRLAARSLHQKTRVRGDSSQRSEDDQKMEHAELRGRSTDLLATVVSKDILMRIHSPSASRSNRTLEDIMEDTIPRSSISPISMMMATGDTSSQEGALPKVEETPEGYEDLVLEDSLLDVSFEEPSSSFASVQRSSARERLSASFSKADLLSEMERAHGEINGAEIVEYEFGLEQNRASISNSMQIQFMDERSEIALGRVYPVSGLQVKVLGSQVNLSSDARGVTFLDELPQSADVLVATKDEGGIYKNMMIELKSSRDEAEAISRVTVIRSFAFDMWTEMARVVENANTGQFCGRVYAPDYLKALETESLENGVSPSDFDADGFEVAIDRENDGIFYFNNLGYIDARLDVTAENGKFCIFNVEEGPAVVDIFDGEKRIFTKLVEAVPGFSQYLDITPEYFEGTISYGILGAAYEQLSDDRDLENKLSLVDFAPLEIIETEDQLTYVGPGQLGFGGITRDVNGSFHVLVDAFELEPLFVRIDGVSLRPEYVTGLLPRGFTEDLAVYLNQVYDSSKGQVIQLYGLRDGETEVTTEIYTYTGDTVVAGQVFDEKPLAKTAFFNLDPGRYVVIVKDTATGMYLDMQFAHVFSGRITLVSGGRKFTTR